MAGNIKINIPDDGNITFLRNTDKYQTTYDVTSHKIVIFSAYSEHGLKHGREVGGEGFRVMGHTVILDHL
jgi:acid phosphatase class B